MSNLIINRQTEIYRDSYSKFGDTPKGVYINDVQTQYLRFDKIVHGFNISKPFTLLDVGCGTCTLHKYLLERKIKHTYQGVELVEEMTEYSKKKYPSIKIFLGDILTNQKIKKCDWVIASSTFYLKGETSKKDWEKYVYKMINRMFELSTNGISFNLLTAYNTFEATELSYFNPQKVLDFCIKNLSRYVTIDHAYPLYEFTVTVYKSNYIKKLYPGAAYAKYFKNDK
jgi:SAM-dependent methyltransferase